VSNEPKASGKGSAALGRTIVVYVGAAYAVLEGVDLFVGRLGLPDWTFAATAVALAAGFPVVLLTAWLSATGAGEAYRDTTGTRAPLHIRLFTWRNAMLGGLCAFALIGVAQSGAWLLGLSPWQSEARWAREEGLPLLSEYLETRDYAAAFPIAERVRRVLPEDSLSNRLIDGVTRVDTLRSDPPGAVVYRRSWSAPDEVPAIPDWETLGTTPLPVRSPRGSYGLIQYRLELEGHGPGHIGGIPLAPVRLFPLGSPDERMATIPRTNNPSLLLPGFEHIELGSDEGLPSFLLGRYEVTNREYRAFVEAGGYQSEGYWTEPFVENGRVLGHEEAMSRFVDRTGRPGPSTWVAGDHLDGQGDLPVSGISWFEASAYARFAGKRLPTIWHWSRASSPQLTHLMVPLANMVDGSGPRAVNSSESMSRYGVFDMAGNVREWTATEDPTRDARYILGGGWNDPEYLFNDAGARSAWDRTETNGLRLADFGRENDPASRATLEPVASQTRDFYAESPVADEVFAAFERMYAYDPIPLNAVIEQTDTTDEYIGQLVTVDAAYDSERLILYVYRPLTHEGSLQPVVVFPGSGAIYQRESRIGTYYREFDFLLKSGRAAVLPVYKGTYERGGELESDYENESVAFRDHVVKWAQDMNRTIDYIETVDDLDQNRVGYYGVSWGGVVGGLIPAVAPRIKAVTLVTAGLAPQRALPEAMPFNFLPRVTQPVIMINGEHDFFFPLETAQKPMFDFLGTPEGLKRHVVYPGSHSVPRDLLISEALDWFDEHLGPVGPQ